MGFLSKPLYVSPPNPLLVEAIGPLNCFTTLSRRIGGEMQTGISVGSRMRGRGTVREGERRGEAMSE